MNIFLLDEDTRRAARFHCNAHVVKMIVESAQLLSAVHHRFETSVANQVYKVSHAKHPATLWLAEAGGNYVWLLDLAKALCDEYTHRYGKVHSTQRLIDGPLQAIPGTLYGSRNKRTRFVQCMPEQYKGPDAVHAYRLYYVGEKMHFAKWTKRAPPYWIEEVRQEAEGLKEQI